MDKRVDYLDGLKGLMTVFVVFTHYMLALFPKGYVGFGCGLEGNLKEEVVANLSWSLLSNTSISLYLFFAMIPMFVVLSYRKHGDDVAVLQRQAAGRYFQFMIPVFAATVLAFVLYECGFLKYKSMAELTGSLWSLALVPATHDVGLTLFYGLFGIYFNNRVEVLTVLWCMYIIFLGSMLTYGIWALFGNSRHRYLAGIVYVIVGCFLPEYLVFAGGAIMGEILYRNQKQEESGNSVKKTLIGSLCIILGTVLGLVPAPLLPEHVTLYLTYTLASMLILYGVIQCRWAQKILSWRGVAGISNYGFSVILCHIFVLYSFSYWLYRLLMRFIADEGVLFGLTFLISLGVILVCSKLFFWLFERPSRSLAKKISGYLCGVK